MNHNNISNHKALGSSLASCTVMKLINQYLINSSLLRSMSQTTVIQIRVGGYATLLSDTAPHLTTTDE